MRIGISAGSYHSDLSVFKTELSELKKVGFDSIDYQGFVNTQTELYEMDEESFTQYLLAKKQIADALGIRIFQTHGPWRWPTLDATSEGRDAMFEKMMRAIRGTHLLGCDRMIVHNVMPQQRIDTDPAYVRSINRELLTRLCAYAKDFGVTVCLENMPFACQSLARPHQTLGLVRELNLDNLRVCLDTGHAQVLNCPPANAVRLLGKEMLFALHVHDNDGLRDRHWLIGDGVIDWAEFGTALREIHFDGCFSIESKIKAPIGSQEYETALKKLYAAAQNILNK